MRLHQGRWNFIWCTLVVALTCMIPKLCVGRPAEVPVEFFNETSTTTELTVPFDKDTIHGYDFVYERYGSYLDLSGQKNQTNSDLTPIKNPKTPNETSISTEGGGKERDKRQIIISPFGLGYGYYPYYPYYPYYGGGFGGYWGGGYRRGWGRGFGGWGRGGGFRGGWGRGFGGWGRGGGFRGGWGGRGFGGWGGRGGFRGGWGGRGFGGWGGRGGFGGRGGGFRG